MMTDAEYLKSRGWSRWVHADLSTGERYVRWRRECVSTTEEIALQMQREEDQAQLSKDEEASPR